MKITSIRMGQDSGGLACGPMGGSLYTEVAYTAEDGSALYVLVSRFEDFEKAMVSRTSLFETALSLADMDTEAFDKALRDMESACETILDYELCDLPEELREDEHAAEINFARFVMAGYADSEKEPDFSGFLNTELAAHDIPFVDEEEEDEDWDEEEEEDEEEDDEDIDWDEYLDCAFSYEMVNFELLNMTAGFQRSVVEAMMKRYDVDEAALAAVVQAIAEGYAVFDEEDAEEDSVLLDGKYEEIADISEPGSWLGLNSDGTGFLCTGLGQFDMGQANEFGDYLSVLGFSLNEESTIGAHGHDSNGVAYIR